MPFFSNQSCDPETKPHLEAGKDPSYVWTKAGFYLKAVDLNGTVLYQWDPTFGCKDIAFDAETQKFTFDGQQVITAGKKYSTPRQYEFPLTLPTPLSHNTKHYKQKFILCKKLAQKRQRKQKGIYSCIIYALLQVSSLYN